MDKKIENRFARVVKTLEGKIEALEKRPDAKELVENLQKELAELKDSLKEGKTSQTKIAEIEELKVKMQELEGYLKSGPKFVNGEWQVSKPKPGSGKEKELEPTKEPEPEKDNDWLLW